MGEVVPPEVLVLILEWAGPLSWPSCRFVCRRWRDLTSRASRHYAAMLAREGWLSVLRWACDNGCPRWTPDICAAAAEGGHLEVLRWARSVGCPWDKRTCLAAARAGHLDILQWAHMNGCLGVKSACEAAAECGHPHIVQWGIKIGLPLHHHLAENRWSRWRNEH